MKRNLLKQMKNEWRDNVWLVIELAVVTIVIWVLLLSLYYQTDGLWSPRGFNPEDVYTLEYNFVKEDSPYYVEQDDEGEGKYDDFRELMRRLRENKHVESVAFHWNVLPYNYNYNGNVIDPVEFKDSIRYYGNCRWASEDVVDVLQLKSLTGSTAAELKEMMHRGEILIADNPPYENDGRDPKDLIGKKVYLGEDSTKAYRVGDVIQNIRRTDYELSYSGGMVVPLPASGENIGGIILRLKPGHEDAFISDFNNNESLRRLRNVYLSDLQSLMDIREACQRSVDTDVNIFFLIVIFLLVTTFLGLLGTFWFRMQQRVSEIAIRKVCGADRSDIFRRIISEGMILLSLAVVVVSVIGWGLFFGIDTPFEWEKTLAGECVAVILVGIGIILSLWYPASRAMNIEPAIAIKSE